MERLIMQYVTGDGFEYSYQHTLPFVYDNKPKAIAALKGILQEHLKIETELKNHLALNEEKQHQLWKTLNKLKPNKLSYKAEQVCAKLKELQLESANLKNAANHLIQFGGQTLDCLDFMETTPDGNLIMVEPNILTLDEFYSKVEQK